MESQEILSAIEEATTPLGMERPVLTRETRFDFSYADDLLFDKPLVIRGTNKFLVPSDHTISFEDSEECGVQEVINMCQNVDDNLEIDTIENVSSLRVLFLNNDYMILHDDVMEGGSGRSCQLYPAHLQSLRNHQTECFCLTIQGHHQR